MSEAPLIVLCGATATGKTGVAIALCQKLDGEVLGADSVQVYRGLDIGSAKPTLEEQAQARHHMVDVADPDEEFDAARFQKLADAAIGDMQGRGKRVVVAGGTGLYIRALLHGLAPAPPVDETLRVKLSMEWDESTPQVMHRRLAELDPEAAAKLHPNDRQRVLRALEVCIATGEPFSGMQKAHGFKSVRYPHALIGLMRPKPELDERIAKRCRLMWEQGFVDEVRGLLDKGVSPQARGMQSLGYRHALNYLSGEWSKEQAMELMIRDTRRYAKRQLTWFRGLEGIHWHQPDDISGMITRA
jgi:tRNA dimethylallyltransferase